MSASDLTDLQLEQLLGHVAPPRPPSENLADRIVARALRTSQSRASPFQIPAGRGSRRRAAILSAVIAANIMAAAAAATSWDGHEFDFHRLIDLPQRVASAVHIGRHDRSSHHDEQPHVVLRAAPHGSPVSAVARVSPAPSAPLAARRVVVQPRTIVVSAMPPHPRVHVARAEHAKQLVHLPSVSKHSAWLMHRPHLSSQVVVRMQHITSAPSPGPVHRQVAPKAELERTRTIAPRATQEWEAARQAAAVQQTAPEIRPLNEHIGSNSQPPAVEERPDEPGRAVLPGTRRRGRDWLMFRREHSGVRRNRMRRKF